MLISQSSSMLMLPPSVRICLAVEPADIRKGIDGLMAVVCNQFGRDAYSRHLFSVHSPTEKRTESPVLGSRRLRRLLGTIGVRPVRTPRFATNESTVSMTSIDLAMLLEGIDLSHVRKPKLWSPQKSDARGSTSAAA